LEEALALDRPDHDLENRSAAGSTPNAMHGVRFGTATERDRKRAYFHNLYRLVDRGLQALNHEQDLPVILAGVEQDTALCREITTNPNLVKNTIRGSPHLQREQTEIMRKAYSILRAEDLERQWTTLFRLRDKTAPSRFSTGPDTILNAASPAE
jgi:Bacterial archaeo-eukaryotic release factor family 3